MRPACGLLHSCQLVASLCLCLSRSSWCAALQCCANPAWFLTHFFPVSPSLPLPAVLSLPQERPEDIPTGELPRTLLMVVDRHLVGRVTPGSRLVVTGIYCTHRCAHRGAAQTDAHHLRSRISVLSSTGHTLR